ncbi:MAG: hypothetical protein JST68_11720 [Bacteroidetes bacterium]|nr:hypothetical protein [Bacteroidota bacterium]
MLTAYEIPGFIAFRLPEVRLELSQSNAYQAIQVLTDYTKRMALEHDYKMVQKCMSLVNKLYEKGNALVRNAVENVFIFSFSSLMTHCNAVEWRMVQTYMPSDLYTIYVRQVLKSKC